MEVNGSAGCGLRPEHLLKSIQIAEGWEFSQVEDQPERSSEWLPVSSFPTTVHADLAYRGLIPDPNVAKNEEHVQWVGEQSWAYRTKFESPSLSPTQKAVLAFDGLDTHATISLNGKQRLKTNNMFTPERLDITKHLNKTTGNELEIVFESSYFVGKKIVESDPDHKYGCWNAEITARCEVEGIATEVRFEVSFEGRKVATETVGITDGLASAVLRTQKPKLWYPARYGNQPLYELKAILYAGDSVTLVCDMKTKRFGLRRAELVQRELDDATGTTFFFQINNIPVFCGGSNWIPADMSIPRIGPSKYRALVKLALAGNHSMIRVWGGGIYEEDVFYDSCDELGILVWQDFLFACGNYPANDDFLDLVKREATASVKRLRHHPCIVLWAGNNEDYQYRETENLDYDPQDQNPENWLKTNFPARYIYEKILVDVTQELVPNSYYHFGSPFGGKSTRDPTVGDIHQWNDWDKLGGRFVSEFGMEAFPSISTIDSYLPNGKDDQDRYAQSSTVDFHNKAVGHERRLATYLVENIPYSQEPFDYYVYCTQLMQAECIATAMRLWKREWKGRFLDITINTKRIIEEIPADKYTHAHIKRVHKVQIFATNLSLNDRQFLLKYQGWDISTGQQLFSEQTLRPQNLKHNQSTEIYVRELGDTETVNRMVFAAYLIHPKDDQIVARSINWPEPLKYIHFPAPKNLRIEMVPSQDTSNVIEIHCDVPVKGFVLEVENSEKHDIVCEDNCVDLVPGEAIQIGVQGLDSIKEPNITYRYLKAAIDL
ncbi:MAG: hypothetical protein Q9176_002572 [Flavoplaca citrina]